MACKIIYKGVSYDESDFKRQIERYVAINNLFNENQNLANQVYEALGFISKLNKLRVQDLKTKMANKFNDSDSIKSDLKSYINKYNIASEDIEEDEAYKETLQQIKDWKNARVLSKIENIKKGYFSSVDVIEYKSSNDGKVFYYTAKKEEGKNFINKQLKSLEEWKETLIKDKYASLTSREKDLLNFIVDNLFDVNPASNPLLNEFYTSSEKKNKNKLWKALKYNFDDITDKEIDIIRIKGGIIDTIFAQHSAYVMGKKEGISELPDNLAALELSKITPQQKQQATLLYSQYLNSIFPDSKVKDIVYHGTNEKFDTFDFTREKTDPFTKDGAYFATIPYGYKEKLPALLDIKNPKEFADITDTSNKFGELEKSTEFDSAIGKSTSKGYENYREYVVFEPEQIHILGSKQDIEGFKEFVSKPGQQEVSLEEQIQLLEYRLSELKNNKALMEDSIPVIVAKQLPKITPESAMKETGVKIGTVKDINPSLLSKNGVSVERAAELLTENELTPENGFPEVDMQDVRNYIIEILQIGTKNFIAQYTNQNEIDNIVLEIKNLKESIKEKSIVETDISLETGTEDLFNLDLITEAKVIIAELLEMAKNNLEVKQKLLNFIKENNGTIIETQEQLEKLKNILC